MDTVLPSVASSPFDNDSFPKFSSFLRLPVLYVQLLCSLNIERTGMSDRKLVFTEILRLLNISGNGLQFVSSAPFSASALNYTIESLDDGDSKDQRHSPEVEKADFTNFCIDKAQTGLACVNSWGAIALEKYRLPYQDYELSFIMTPVYHKIK